MSNNTSPVWIVDPGNVGKTDPTYPSMKLDTQLITRYYGSNAVSQGQVTVNLITANILGMFETPVDILPSPGAGNGIIVHSFTYENVFNTNAFLNGGAVSLVYDTNNTPAATLLATATALQVVSSVVSITGVSAAVSVANMLNRKLQITNGTGAFTTGNGSAKITVVYSILAL